MATEPMDMDEIVATLGDLQMARASDVADWLARPHSAVASALKQLEKLGRTRSHGDLWSVADPAGPAPVLAPATPRPAKPVSPPKALPASLHVATPRDAQAVRTTVSRPKIVEYQVFTVLLEDRVTERTVVAADMENAARTAIEAFGASVLGITYRGAAIGRG